MSTLASVEKQFYTPGIRQQGAALVAEKCLHVVDFDERGLLADVRTRTGHFYQVEVNLDEDGVVSEMMCDCEEFAREDFCEHTWAAILKFDELQALITPKNNRASGKKNQKAAQAAKPDPRWLQSMKLVLTEAPNLRGSGHVVSEASVVLSSSDQFWYVIDVNSSLQKQMVSLDVKIQQERSTGVPGTTKEFRISRNSLQQILHPEHAAVMSELLNCAEGSAPRDYGYGYGYDQPRSYSRISLKPLMQMALLPKIAATGRLCWRLSSDAAMEDAPFVAWQHDEPWQVDVRFKERRKTQEWVITAALTRTVQTAHSDPEQQTRSLADIIYLDPGGVALFPDCLAVIDLQQSEGWLRMLQQSSEIRVPFADRERFLQKLAATPKLSGLPMPQRLTRAARDVTCQPRIRLLPPEKVPHRMRHMKFVFGHVEFLYGDNAVSLRDKRSMLWNSETSRLLVRDRTTETRFASQLSELGVKPIAQDFSGDDIDVKIAQDDMPSVVRRLMEYDWHVEAAGVRLKRPGVFNIGVTSGQDWFELNASISFDGVSASLPALLQAVQKGEEFVRLSDGSRGMLPENWLNRYSALANMGQVVDDTIRFQPSQAMLLDALLAAQDGAERDRGFTKFCRKLKSFSGIKPREAPKTFQGELRDYQKDGLSWLHFLNEFRLGGCLADDMGLGKTIQVLALLEGRRKRRLKPHEERKPSLVVVPKSLVFNWVEEAARFVPHLTLLNYTGLDRKPRLESELEQADVVVTTYGTMRKDIVSLKEIAFDYIVLDEAQAIKNSQSLASKAARLLVSDHRLAMTGTPVENHLGELWALFEFLNPGMLGSSRKFQQLTITSGDDVGQAQALKTLSQSLRPFLLRRTKTDVLTELPGKTEQTIVCEMSAKQRKQYNELRDYYRTQLTQKVDELGVNKAKIHVLEALLRLRQAACHPGLIDKTRTGQNSAKLDAAVEQLQELVAEGHKALVFSQFTSLLFIVRQRLDQEGIGYEYLDGKTRNRQQCVENFQTDETCSLFLISLKAGGHGLNLTAADYVFILDPWWNPAVEAQAVDRAHRMGQDRHVFAYRLICKDTVEERILQMQKDKKELADAIVSADSSLIKNLTADDLQLLLS